MSQTIVFSKTVTLTDADIKLLESTPFEIIPAPGNGKILSILQVVVITNLQATYTGINPATGASASYITPVYLKNGDPYEFMTYRSDLANFFSAPQNGGTFFGPIQYESAYGGAPIVYSSSVLENASLNLYMNNYNTEVGGGDPASTIKVTAMYSIIDIV